jgi:histidine triad (HIT) family protein
MSAGVPRTHDCVFCRIISGEAPASPVLDRPTVLAFMDQRQSVRGHVLVVPRRHVASLHELDASLAGELMAVAVEVARAMHAAWAPEGLSLWQSNGEAAGQEVPHVHLHVHPRRLGDGLLQIYPESPPIPPRAHLDAMAAEIRAAFPHGP